MHRQSPADPGFKDRRRWVVSVGILQVFLGLICAFFSLLLPLLSLVIPSSPPDASVWAGSNLVANVLLLIILGSALIWLGIGAIRIRRWARDLMFLGSLIWLITGLVSLALLAILIQQSDLRIGDIGQSPLGEGAVTAAIILIGIILTFVYVIIPGVFALFYGGSDVRKTFEAFDPTPGWTAKCPLSVLCVSQFLAGAALTFMLMAIYVGRLAFFGFAVRGIAAKIILILAALLSAYLTWAIYRMKPHAWWINLSATVLILIWLIADNWRFGLMAYLTKVGAGTGLSLATKADHLTDSRLLTVIIAIAGAAWMGFLLKLKKHFKQGPESHST